MKLIANVVWYLKIIIALVSHLDSYQLVPLGAVCQNWHRCLKLYYHFENISGIKIRDQSVDFSTGADFSFHSHDWYDAAGCADIVPYSILLPFILTLKRLQFEKLSELYDISSGFDFYAKNLG